MPPFRLRKFRNTCFLTFQFFCSFIKLFIFLQMESVNGKLYKTIKIKKLVQKAQRFGGKEGKYINRRESRWVEGECFPIPALADM